MSLPGVSPTKESCQPAPSRQMRELYKEVVKRVKGEPPTMYSIDLYQILLYGTIRGWSRPTEGGGIGPDASKRYIGSFGYVDTKDVDEVGYGFPQGLPRPME